MWIPEIDVFDGPRYLALVNAIVKAIDAGQLPPGAQLPTQRELAGALGYSIGTVSRAYSLARDRNLVTGEVGRGTFVPGRRDTARMAEAKATDETRPVDLARFRAPATDSADPLVDVLSDLAGRAKLLQLDMYPPHSGYPTHRTAGATWLARGGLKVDPESVIVTAGAQPAIAAAMAVLAPPGTTVLTESLTYSGMKVLSTACNIALRGVAIDEQGMLPDALDALCAEQARRVLFLQPTLHNPTSRTMDDDRRARIVAVARKRDLTIVEDDAACSGVFSRPPPIAALAPERTVYITSLSKSVSPALRIGFMRAPQPLAERLLVALHGLSMNPSTLMAHAAAALISSGAAFEIAAAHLKECARRRDVVLRSLVGYDVESNPGAFYGLLGLPPGWRADEFCEMAKGVALLPIDSFATSAESARPAVRVSFNAAQDDEALELGLTRLRSVLASRPPFRVPEV